MALTLFFFFAATVLFNSLALVSAIRGLRAGSRAACARCAGRCLAFAVGVALATVVGKAATLAASFGIVAGGDPSLKADLLSQQIGANITIGSIGAPATAFPVILAILLYARSRRLPAARSGQAP